MWGCGAGASAKRVALNYSINVMLKDRPSFFGTAYMSPDGEFPHVFLNPMLARKKQGRSVKTEGAFINRESHPILCDYVCRFNVL